MVRSGSADWQQKNQGEAAGRIWRQAIKAEKKQPERLGCLRARSRRALLLARRTRVRRSADVASSNYARTALSQLLRYCLLHLFDAVLSRLITAVN